MKITAAPSPRGTNNERLFLFHCPRGSTPSTAASSPPNYQFYVRWHWAVMVSSLEFHGIAANDFSLSHSASVERCARFRRIGLRRRG